MASDTDNPTLLQVLVLERVDRAKNMARFYVLSIEPTLFEDLALVRRWGRIGSAGCQRIDLHPSRRVAQMELTKWLDRKRRPCSRRRRRHGFSITARVGFFKSILQAPRRHEYGRETWQPSKGLENSRNTRRHRHAWRSRVVGPEQRRQGRRLPARAAPRAALSE
jgi:predicted DNA-binding WGR domain protein